jgi:hypothetical protein
MHKPLVEEESQKSLAQRWRIPSGNRSSAMRLLERPVTKTETPAHNPRFPQLSHRERLKHARKDW